MNEVLLMKGLRETLTYGAIGEIFGVSRQRVHYILGSDGRNNRPSNVIICPCCNEAREHEAKGLCTKCYRSLYYKEHKEEIKAYQSKNRDKYRASCRRYYYRNRERLLPIMRKRASRYYWEHREEILAKNKRRREDVRGNNG